MKKILTITAMLLIVSLAFFSCDNREFEGSPATLTETTVDSAALSKYPFYGASDPAPVKIEGLTFTFEGFTIGTPDSDTFGVKLTGLPDNYVLYSRVEIELEVIKENTATPAGEEIKIGVKNLAAKDGPDGSTYIDVFLGNKKGNKDTLKIPVTFMDGPGVTLLHNKYPGGGKAGFSAGVIDYGIKINEIKLIP